MSNSTRENLDLTQCSQLQSWLFNLTQWSQLQSWLFNLTQWSQLQLIELVFNLTQCSQLQLIELAFFSISLSAQWQPIECFFEPNSVLSGNY